MTHSALPLRDAKSPVELVHLLAEVGAYGVNFHDNDLIPIDATPAERDQIVKDFKAGPQRNRPGRAHGHHQSLLRSHIFKDGAFTSNDPKVRAYALQKTMNGMDLGAEFGAKIYVFWGGREGVETDACHQPPDGFKRFPRSLEFSMRIQYLARDMVISSPWKPNPMNHAAISTFPPPAPCWVSSPLGPS